MKTFLITGGCGFIGSALVRHLLSIDDISVVNIDKLTYAANPDCQTMLKSSSRYSHEVVDICDRSAIKSIFKNAQPQAVIHLAAESHVDRSIDGPSIFIETNIIGTYSLLEEATQYWSGCDNPDIFRFLSVSTDEVYGSLAADQPSFVEMSPFRPNSPYSASKASADHLVRAWNKTYDLPTLISNCSNNYGPRQFPEKLIPVVILKALAGEPIPIYGNGSNIRDWLFVDDHARALWSIITNGKIGNTYNIGGNCEISNIDLVKHVCSLLDELTESPYKPHENLIRFVPDRPGHDQRYAINFNKAKQTLGWEPKENFKTGLKKTIQWYLQNLEWCDRIKHEAYDGRRLGLTTSNTDA